MQKQIKFDKIRNFGEIFNATFMFLGSNRKVYFKSLFFILAPLSSLLVALRYLHPLLYISSAEIENIDNQQIISFIIVPILFFFLCSLIVSFSYGIMYAYQESKEGNFTWKDVTKHMRKNYNNIASIIIIFSLFVIPFIIIAVFPAIKDYLILSGLHRLILLLIIVLFIFVYFMTITSTAFAISSFENSGAMDSLKKCFTLLKTNDSFSWQKWGTTFGILVITIIILRIFDYITEPDLVLETCQVFIPLTPSKIVAYTIIFFAIILKTLYFILLLPISFIILGFQYFNLKEQNEGTDLTDRVNSLGDAN